MNGERRRTGAHGGAVQRVQAESDGIKGKEGDGLLGGKDARHGDETRHLSGVGVGQEVKGGQREERIGVGDEGIGNGN